jgi:hypothetical protein
MTRKSKKEFNYQTIKFINFNELTNILYKKYHATYDEIRYWIKEEEKYYNRSDDEHEHLEKFLLPFVSDLPRFDGRWELSRGRCFYPEHYFYVKNCAESYIAYPHKRFVYVKDLTALRNWPQYSKKETKLVSCFPALNEAARSGLLRFYQQEDHDFTLYQPSLNEDLENRKLWINTAQGEEYLNDPEKFFLLEDIINIERVFYGRKREDCLKELGFNPNEYIPITATKKSTGDKI